jgi:hypothetical protein
MMEAKRETAHSSQINPTVSLIFLKLNRRIFYNPFLKGK